MWAYTSAASCSVCCTKAGSIQRTSYKRGESSKLYRKGRFIYRKERFESRHALATLQRREAGYPRGHNRHNIYHTYYSAVYSACRLLSGRPTAVTTGTMFITLTTVQSILQQIIVKEGYIFSASTPGLHFNVLVRYQIFLRNSIYASTRAAIIDNGSWPLTLRHREARL